MPDSKVYFPGNPYFEWIDELPSMSGTPFSWERRRTYRREFLVSVRIKEMGPTDVCLCPGLPLPGSIWMPPSYAGPPGAAIEFDTEALLTEMSARRKTEEVAAWNLWIVTCVWSMDFTSRADTPGNTNIANAPNFSSPEQDAADIDWDFEESQEASLYDLNGTAYLNAAYQPFVPAVTRPVNIGVLTISRNETSFSQANAAKYGRALNNATFLGAPRGCVMSLTPKGKQFNKGARRLWRVTYRFKFRPMQFVDPELTGIDRYLLPPLNLIVPRMVKAGGGTTNDEALSTGVFIFDGNGNAIYDAIQATIHDSWQPLRLNEGMYRRGGSQVNDIDQVKGKPVPIYRFAQQVHHPVLLDPNGAESVSAVAGAPPRAWHYKFIDYRYANLNSLLVNGLA